MSSVKLHSSSDNLPGPGEDSLHNEMVCPQDAGELPSSPKCTFQAEFPGLLIMVPVHSELHMAGQFAY